MKAGRARYEFFLSELFQSSDEFAGYVVELMRSAGHMQDFHKLFGLLAPAESDEFDDLVRDAEADSVRILVLNFSASQLRESLKLFARFSRLPAYGELRRKWSKKQESCAQRLTACVEEFDNRSGLLYAVLKPLRDKTFHYDPAAAREWVRDRMTAESQPKPPISWAKPAQGDFGPGFEYDQNLYSRYLFWSETPAESLLKAQAEVWNIQQDFLTFVGLLTETLMKTAKIPAGRSLDWCLRYRYGFRPGGRDDAQS